MIRLSRIRPKSGLRNLLLHTGRVTGQAPSFGSWVNYGLGTANQNLPGYVLLNNDWIPNGGFENFSSAFLPATNTATLLRAKGATIDAENAMITDQSVAALIFDLKQRGLFDDTIVIWAGEMGRTPHTPALSETCGRDHHVNGYSIFVAGGGFRLE